MGEEVIALTAKVSAAKSTVLTIGAVIGEEEALIATEEHDERMF
jgi:hypothetical protein